MLDLARIQAITLDLDDTLWPIWPTITRAETELYRWLHVHAPMTAALFASPGALRDIREQMVGLRPDLQHDLSALRLESIRLALQKAGDDVALAEPAFEVFFAERQRVELFDEVPDALGFLAARFPLLALSNGNADIHRVGIGQHFVASISAKEFGVAKPDPRIFHAAAGALELPPEAVLHVGDDATMDALGALNSGMQAVWLNRQDHPWRHEVAPPPTVKSLSELCALFSEP
ncbi:MAG: HAD-IA family hydrolase [Curvibacter sp.]|nr:HAD-IA family hydrolase [Curvibacter sp.]